MRPATADQGLLRRRLRRALTNPIATLLLGTALGISVASLPPGPPWSQDHSRVGALVRGLLTNRARPTGTRRYPIERFCLLEDGGLRLLDPESESWDEVSRAFETRPGDVLLIRLRLGSSSTGLWAPTRQDGWAVITTHFGERFSAGERVEARRRFVDDVLTREARATPDTLARLRVEDIHDRRTLWSGHAHNAAVLLVLLAFVYSLQWVPRVPGWVRARRGARRLARGLCPGCRYALAGLAGGRCPECGAELPVRGGVAGGPG